jgi:hypothetical protein
MDVGSAVNISEVHAASIFRIEVCRVGEILCSYRFIFRKEPCGGGLVPRSCQ